MSISIKQAYEQAKDILDGFTITSCTELPDSWIFYSKHEEKDVYIPPIEIFKSGKEADFWAKHREFMNVFDEDDWLTEHGKNIPISELEKMSE